MTILLDRQGENAGCLSSRDRQRLSRQPPILPGCGPLVGENRRDEDRLRARSGCFSRQRPAGVGTAGRRQSSEHRSDHRRRSRLWRSGQLRCARRENAESRSARPRRSAAHRLLCECVGVHANPSRAHHRTLSAARLLERPISTEPRQHIFWTLCRSAGDRDIRCRSC